MAFSCVVKKRLDVEVENDTNPTVILALEAKDTADGTKVYELQQTEGMTGLGIAIRPYGLVVIPDRAASTQLTFSWKAGDTTETTTQKAISAMTIGIELAQGGAIN